MLNNLKNFLGDNKGQFGEIPLIGLIITAFLGLTIFTLLMAFLHFFIHMILGIVFLALGIFMAFKIVIPYLKEYDENHPHNKYILIIITVTTAGLILYGMPHIHI